jgi:D-glycero-beta-D-manno-heptose-7-phosphate kinase
MQLKRVEDILKTFPTKRVLVIGDLMLDEFVWGRVSRISPEAPVPVVEVVRESYYPGGAANVARNIHEFCPSVRLMGLIGDDLAGEKLRQILAQGGIGLDALQVETDYSTIVKTRIIARQQQVVRVDREAVTAPSIEVRERCLGLIADLLPEIDGIILEDYGKGFFGQDFVDRITALGRAEGKILTADPNPRNAIIWRGLTGVKPNRQEAFAAAKQPWAEPALKPLEDDALLAVGAILLEEWQPEYLLVTLGEQGMILFGRSMDPYHVPSRAREVFDLSGAGDTAVSLFTLALMGGATAVEAAELSNHASSVVVGKLGTATVTPAELLESFRANYSS